MRKLPPLKFEQWNDMVPAFHNESDRGAAVLAAGFVDNLLESFLRALVVSSKLADQLFGSFGPLGGFGQRIAVAYAFGFLPLGQHRDLDLIRRIRNYFAHHPLDASFATEAIAGLSEQLSTWETAKNSKPSITRQEQSRYAYLFACAMLSGYLHTRIEKKRAQGAS